MTRYKIFSSDMSLKELNDVKADLDKEIRNKRKELGDEARKELIEVIKKWENQGINLYADDTTKMGRYVIRLKEDNIRLGY